MRLSIQSITSALARRRRLFQSGETGGDAAAIRGASNRWGLLMLLLLVKQLLLAEVFLFLQGGDKAIRRPFFPLLVVRGTHDGRGGGRGGKSGGLRPRGHKAMTRKRRRRFSLLLLRKRMLLLATTALMLRLLLVHIPHCGGSVVVMMVVVMMMMMTVGWAGRRGGGRGIRSGFSTRSSSAVGAQSENVVVEIGEIVFSLFQIFTV